MAKQIDYASLFTLRKDGRYQAYLPPPARGEKPKYIYDRDPEKLYKKVSAASKPKEPLFSDMAEAWHSFAWERLSDGTKGCYASAYKRALSATEGVEGKDVTALMISRHLEQLKRKKLGLKTVKTQRTVYSLIFQFAINDEYFGRFITDNPAKNAVLPKGLVSVKREAPEDDILTKVRQNALTATWGLFAFFLIATGFRRGEALAIQWRDVDFEKKTISCTKALKYRGSSKIEQPKFNSVRTVPLLPDLEKVLVMPKTASPDDYIFAADCGKPMSESTYRRRWLHYCKDQGFVETTEEKYKTASGAECVRVTYKNTLTAHVLRHGYATMLFEADVDVYTAQKLLGHADISTTMAVYTHLREKKNKESIEKLKTYVSNNYTA